MLHNHLFPQATKSLKNRSPQHVSTDKKQPEAVQVKFPSALNSRAAVSVMKYVMFDTEPGLGFVFIPNQR